MNQNQIIEIENIAEYQKTDPFIIEIRKIFTSKSYCRNSECFTISDNCVYRIWQQKLIGKTVLQLVIPEKLVKHVFHQFHGAHIAGHFGVPKVTNAILLCFWWKNLLQDVIDWVKCCPECQMSNAENNQQMPLVPIPVSGPWEKVSVDCLTIKPSNTDRTNVVVKCHEIINIFISLLIMSQI